MRPSMDVPQVQQGATLCGTFGSAVYDPVSSAYIAYGYNGIPFGRMLPSASYGSLPSSDNFTLVNPSVDVLAYLKLGEFKMCTPIATAKFSLGCSVDLFRSGPRRPSNILQGSKKTIKSGKCPAFFSILATVLGRIIDGTPSNLLRNPHRSLQPKATHKRNNKNKTKKAKKATPTAILGRIIDALSKYTKASRRLVTHTISSLLSRLILRRASESASLLKQTQDTHQKKNKKKTKRKTKKTKKTPGTLSTPSYTHVFGVLRGSAASNSNHGNVDAEAEEYLRSAFNVPDARSPPLVGWSDYEVDEAPGTHPPVEELDSWMFPSVPFEPFSHPLPSDDALATLAGADANPTRPFGVVRMNYIERVDYDEAYENAMLNVALDLPFSMEPFIFLWQSYCFPHEQSGWYPPVKELDEWAGMLEPRPMLAYDMREGPGPPMFVDIGERWDDLSRTTVLLPFFDSTRRGRLTCHELSDVLDVEVNEVLPELKGAYRNSKF
ncbi:hypothetical protein ONZ51_g12885 [Trametes cubensis]|uniref:Uncharacterized protein n=1 Tax=Trametes cubensis TaxID=1111947 RepID=A0AAD7X6G7_9APHY|nr:hypothetical protein ONZ51_g12885 [Trametes cubensis]